MSCFYPHATESSTQRIGSNAMYDVYPKNPPLCFCFAEQDFGTVCMTRWTQRKDGSLSFPNVFCGSSNNESYFVTYQSIVNILYSFTFRAQKTDLATLLIGTRNPETSISRFFHNPLCERKVLCLVNEF